MLYLSDFKSFEGKLRNLQELFLIDAMSFFEISSFELTLLFKYVGLQEVLQYFSVVCKSLLLPSALVAFAVVVIYLCRTELTSMLWRTGSRKKGYAEVIALESFLKYILI